MCHPGEYFINQVNNLIDDNYKEDKVYQKFLEDYFKEKLKEERLRVIVGYREILDTEVEKYGDVVHKFKNADAILMDTRSDLLEALLNIRSVRFVEPDYPVELIKPQVDTESKDANTDWNMKLIGAPYAWDTNARGRGIKLGILDTGIDYEHPCLKNNFKGGYNFVSNNKDPFDDNGHGTHCAGIAAACPAGGENDLHGVAIEADLYGLKVLNDKGGGTTSNIVAGVDWSVNNGLNILSMSFGSRFPSSAIHEALTAAHDRGLILVAAAGNETIGPSFPGFFRAIVSVGAIDKNKKPASFTNRDPHVNIAAPGVSVYSTIPGAKFASFSGTSMACPHVSGVFASILGEKSISNTEAEDLIYDTAEDIRRHSWEVGHGLVRLDNALKR